MRRFGKHLLMMFLCYSFVSWGVVEWRRFHPRPCPTCVQFAKTHRYKIGRTRDDW